MTDPNMANKLVYAAKDRLNEVIEALRQTLRHLLRLT